MKTRRNSQKSARNGGVLCPAGRYGAAVCQLPEGRRKSQEEEAYVLGMESYVYGFPLVIMDVSKGALTAASSPAEYTAPMNQFARMTHYVSPDFKTVVRVSLNGLWSRACVDLGPEPFVFSVPDSHGRYYVTQATNMWTDDFASIGYRTTGTGPGNFLFVGPKWNGTAPPDVKETYRAATRYVWVINQVMAKGPKDFAAAFEISKGFKLTPLSAWGKPYTPPTNVPVEPSGDVSKDPFDLMDDMDAGTFFKRLAMLMVDNPPYPADGPALAKMKRLGIEPGKDFDITKVDPKIARGLNRATKEAWNKLAAGPLEMKGTNGWVNFLGLGQFGTDYNTRAAIAILGLGALTKAEELR